MAMATDWQSGKTLSESISFMFEKEIDTDVTFRFPNSDETIKAHRLILKARSRVFYTMFHSGLENPGEDMEIPDIEPDIFLEFLRYLYLDHTKLSISKALHLFYCAEKYDVKELKAQCITFLLESINETTWEVILDHAVLFSEDSLTKACLPYFTSGDILEKEGIEEEYHITRDTLEVILEYDEHSVKEVDIFKFCNKWTEQECITVEVPITMENKRKVLGPLLKKIPFCSMTQMEFMREVSGRDFLNGQEELQILRYLCAADKGHPPFPCKKRPQANGVKDLQVSIRLPEVWDISKGGVYTFSIKCITQKFTLLGMTFREPGSYLISYGSLIESLEVQPECLTVSLKEAARCDAGTRITIQDARFEYPHKVGCDFPFSSYVNSQDSGLYKKLDFVVTKYDDFSKPPFDSLIVRL